MPEILMEDGDTWDSVAGVSRWRIRGVRLHGRGRASSPPKPFLHNYLKSPLA